jgi:hypothetical protein
VKTYFTYALQHGNRVSEIPDVKDRDDKFDIGIVTDAVDSIESAGLTECILLRRTLEERDSHPVDRVERDISVPSVDRVRHPSPGPCPS